MNRHLKTIAQRKSASPKTLHSDSPLMDGDVLIVDQSGRRGFTLVEILGVNIIILVLISLLLPAIQQSREAARRAQCRNHLMQIGVALSNYAHAHDMLPPGTQDQTGPIQSVKDGGYHMNWIVQILPFLEQSAAYNQIDFTQSVYSPANSVVQMHVVPQLRCTSVGTNDKYSTSYFGVHNDYETPININQNGVLFLNSSIDYDQITDGCSQTMFVIEGRKQPNSNLGWMSGTKFSLSNAVVRTFDREQQSDATHPPMPTYKLHALVYDYQNTAELIAQMKNIDDQAGESVGGAGSFHSSGFHVLMGDGAVRFVSANIDATLFRNLAHRADGELTPLD